MEPPFTGIVVKNRNQYELGYLTEFNQIGTKITLFPGGSNLTGETDLVHGTYIIQSMVRVKENGTFRK